MKFTLNNLRPKIKYNKSERRQLIDKGRKSYRDGYLAGYSEGGRVPKSIPKSRFDDQTYIYKPFELALISNKSEEIIIFSPTDNSNKIGFQIFENDKFILYDEIELRSVDLIFNAFSENILL